MGHAILKFIVAINLAMLVRYDTRLSSMCQRPFCYRLHGNTAIVVFVARANIIIEPIVALKRNDSTIKKNGKQLFKSLS